MDYLNKPADAPPDQHSANVTIDVLNYMMKRADMSSTESMGRVVQPPAEHSEDYQQLVVRPGELFMLLLYVEKHLSYHLITRDPGVGELYTRLHHAQTEGYLSNEWFEAWWYELEPIQISLVAQNSDKGFAALVDELDHALSGVMPDLQREPNIDNLKELVDIRNMIGHATIYNEMTAGDQIIIEPHITKHTSSRKRKIFSTVFDDEVYSYIKGMINDAHSFLEACVRLPIVRNKADAK